MKNLKQRMGICLALMLMLTPLAADCGEKGKPTPEKPIVLKFATHYPQTSCLGQSCKWWGNEIEKRTGGRLKFKFYFAGALLGAKDVTSGISKGVADCGAVPCPYDPASFPLMMVVDAIYVTRYPDASSRACNEVARSYEPLRSEWENLNLKYITSNPSGAIMFTFRKKVDTMEKMRGLKVRAVGKWIKDVKRLGAIPVSIAGPEMYEGMERGIIDGGFVIPLDVVAAIHLYEVAPYILDAGMGVYVAGLVNAFNLDTWNELPSDIQDIILGLSDEFIDKTIEIMMAVEDKAAQTIIAAGGTLYSLTHAEEARWRKAVTPECWDEYIDKLEQKGLPARKLFDRYIALVRKYEKESKYIPAVERHKVKE